LHLCSLYSCIVTLFTLHALILKVNKFTGLKTSRLIEQIVKKKFQFADFLMNKCKINTEIDVNIIAKRLRPVSPSDSKKLYLAQCAFIPVRLGFLTFLACFVYGVNYT